MYTNRPVAALLETNMETLIDHLVVAAPARKIGIDYVSDRLGVEPQLGGNHEQMGTHNALLKLGDKIYLEVIAIDPDARSPQRLRWFGLDQRASEPRLVTWVVRTDDIYTAAKKLSLGSSIETMSRGQFSWLISIPPDGKLTMAGTVPTLIQWLSHLHPCHNLNNSGCELLALEIRHPDAASIKLALEQIDFASPLVHLGNGPTSVRATIKTPAGIREL